MTGVSSQLPVTS